MTYSKTQLEIIKAFGSKELSEGCLIEWTDMQEKQQITKYCAKVYEGQHMVTWKDTITAITDKFEILGHIPHLEDVFRLAKNNKYSYQVINGRLLIYDAYDGGPINSSTPYRKGIDIKCDTCIPLIDQQESVLIELLTIFK